MSENNGASASRSLMLMNVRLSFPDLFVPKQYQGDPKAPLLFKASFLIEPGSQNDLAVKEAINKAALGKWADKAAAVLAKINGQRKEFCYLNGDVKEYAGYEGKMVLTANRKAENGPPAVINKDKSPLIGTEGIPYSGCYVNAKVSIWAQDNQWGKAMRCTLEAVQFRADGDAFTGGGPANADGFEEVVGEDVSDLM